jgi:hypothetical protein
MHVDSAIMEVRCFLFILKEMIYDEKIGYKKAL